MRLAWTWLQGYNGPTVIASILVGGILMSAGARQLIPSFDHAAVPLGMLAPAIIAMLVGIGVSSRLPTPQHFAPRLLLARTLWVGTVAGSGALAIGLVGQTYPVEGAVLATVTLTLYTFGISAVVGRGAPLLGAAVAAWVVMHTGVFRGLSSESWLVPVELALPVCLGGAASALVYVVRGSAADHRFAH